MIDAFPPCASARVYSVLRLLRCLRLCAPRHVSYVLIFDAQTRRVSRRAACLAGACQPVRVLRTTPRATDVALNSARRGTHVRLHALRGYVALRRLRISALYRRSQQCASEDSSLYRSFDDTTHVALYASASGTPSLRSIVTRQRGTHASMASPPTAGFACRHAAIAPGTSQVTAGNVTLVRVV